MGGKGSGITQEKERLNRMNELLKFVIKMRSSTETEKEAIEKAINMFQYRYGISRRTTMDYIKILQGVGKLKSIKKR